MAHLHYKSPPDRFIPSQTCPIATVQLLLNHFWPRDWSSIWHAWNFWRPSFSPTPILLQIISDDTPHQRTEDRQLYAVYLLQRYTEFQYVVLPKAMVVFCLHHHHILHEEIKILCEEVLRDVISSRILFLCSTLYVCTLHLCTIKCKAIKSGCQPNESEASPEDMMITACEHNEHTLS